ncbi:MAG: hypothetical protein RIS47_899 [Bacteroidota bacterium]|jgi:POT family proton-dependent oligopeptide transporter
MEKEKVLLGQPIGVFVLAFTEMWERFAFYSMRALLVLFLVDSQVTGGFGWTNKEALTLYGIYNFLMYLMSIPGGWLADRWIGQKNAVRLGGMLIIIGASLFTFTLQWTFFLGMGFMILGVGSLKPNISTLVGGLFGQDDPRRDQAFSFFYMGINLGAAIAGVAAGIVAKLYGWNYGFGLSAIGMIIGQIVFYLGEPYISHVGNNVKKSDSTQAVVTEPFTKVEIHRVFLLIISFIIVMVFWGAFEQAGGLLNLYAKNYTDLKVFNVEIPAAIFQSLNAVYIIIFAVPVASLWIYFTSKRPNISAVFKMGLGTVILGLAYLFMVGAAIEKDSSATGLSSMWWLFGIYLFATWGELCLSPVALSYITKVAPKRIVSSIMGIYFAVTGLGNYVAAEIGKLTEQFDEYTIFIGLVVFCVFFGGALMLFSKSISKLAHGIIN